jgi:hypothetical protein
MAWTNEKRTKAFESIESYKNNYCNQYTLSGISKNEAIEKRITISKWLSEIMPTAIHRSPLWGHWCPWLRIGGGNKKIGAAPSGRNKPNINIYYEADNYYIGILFDLSFSPNEDIPLNSIPFENIWNCPKEIKKCFEFQDYISEPNKLTDGGEGKGWFLWEIIVENNSISVNEDIKRILGEYRALIPDGDESASFFPKADQINENEHLDNAYIHFRPSINLILYGPPGTGKTFRTARDSVRLCDPEFSEDDLDDAMLLRQEYKKLLELGRIEFVTFHQSFTYEDFVQGLRPETNDPAGGETTAGFRLKPRDGVFKRICDRAKKDPEKNYVLVIDEINRANLSKVFGELITLLEEDKRLGRGNEITVRLPYSDENEERFGVPSNLHIVGTMNTADRSIAKLDIALRRRFTFTELEPKPEMLGKNVDNINVQEVLKTINKRIEYLLDREHRIGHAFFMEKKDKGAIDRVMYEKIIPLLQEYFYEDWGKIHAILGSGFVERVNLRANDLGLEEFDRGPVPSWSAIRPPFSVNAYDKLIGAQQQGELIGQEDHNP